MVEPSGSEHLVLQHFHHPPPVVEPGQRVRHGQPLELDSTAAQPRDHVSEDFRQITHLAALADGQVDVEVAGRYLRRRTRQPVERTHDDESQRVTEHGRHEQRPSDDRQRDVAHASEPAIHLVRGKRRHDNPVESRHSPHAAAHALARDVGEFDGIAITLELRLYRLRGITELHCLRRAARGSHDHRAVGRQQRRKPRVSGREAHQSFD